MTMISLNIVAPRPLRLKSITMQRIDCTSNRVEGPRIAPVRSSKRGRASAATCSLKRELHRTTAWHFAHAQAFSPVSASRHKRSFVIFDFGTNSAARQNRLSRTRPTQGFSLGLGYRVQLIDEHAHVLAVIDGHYDEMHAAFR